MSLKEIDKFHTNPVKLIIAGLLVIGLFFGGLGGIAATLPFSGAVIAEGIVKISDERKIIQHLEGGIVDQIFVKEGNKVNRGDVLIKLRSSAVDASFDMTKGMLLDYRVKADRLSAEKSLIETIQWSKEISNRLTDPETQKIIQKETEIFNSRKETLLANINMNRARIRQLKEQISGAEDELVSRKFIIVSLKEEINIKEPLVQENYIDNTELLRLRRQLEENLGMIATKKQAIAASLEKIEEIKISSIDLRNDFKERAVTELGKANESIFEFKERLRPSKDARDRLDIVAPLAGEVINLKIHSEDGGVIRPGEPILDIVPNEAKLVIECKLRLDKITKVKVGQKARIQLAAFNRITTPPISGEVTYISPDMVEQMTPQGPMYHYILKALPKEGELEKNNAYLSSGMPATCFIETERRTFLQYLIEPILLNFDRAVKETM